MSLKATVLFSLNQSRRMLEGLIDAMTSIDDWTYQACPNANHPLWVVGHLGLADNMFLSRIDESLGNKPEGWDKLFWFGSEVHPEADKYPSPDETVAYCRERREALLAKVEALADEFFIQPTPEEGMFAEAPNMASMLLFISYHEGIHTGQFTIAHRGLGHEPMHKPSPQEIAS
jgi:uncharacterized damage-inducible protein DinB